MITYMVTLAVSCYLYYRLEYMEQVCVRCVRVADSGDRYTHDWSSILHFNSFDKHEHTSTD
jgi:hypothetical protein